MKKTIYALFLILFFSCTNSGEKKTNNDEVDFTKISKYECLAAEIKSDTLILSWNDSTINKNYLFKSDENLFKKLSTLETVNPIKDTIISCIQHELLVSQKNSVFIFWNKSILIYARITEKLPINGQDIYCGMSKQKFLESFFLKINTRLQNFNDYYFYEGMGSNGIHFHFTGNRLAEIKIVNYPDGGGENCY